jgi:type I restriction enzyme S subunit
MKKDWPTKSLGDVCRLISGQHIDAKDYNLRMKGIGYLTGPSDFGALHPVVSKWTEHPKITAERGDILLTVKGSGVGKVNVLSDGKVAISRQLMAVRVTGADPGFVYAFLSFAGEHFQSLSTGAAIPGISREQVLSLAIPIPPLPEQQRIVTLLDEAFAGLATAKANAERNLQNARVAYATHLQSIFNAQGKEWEEATVKRIARPEKGSIRTGPFGSQLLHSEFVDGGIAVLGIDNAVDNHFRWGKSRFITPKKYEELERYTVRPGDVLITIMGTCGRCAVVPDDIPTAINTKHLCCITLDKNQCLPDYLHIYFLHAPQSQAHLAKHAKGAIMAGLNMGLIQDLPVFLPPVQIQKEIIRIASLLLEETQHLTHIYERKLAALEELKKSLLQQAFNGEL